MARIAMDPDLLVAEEIVSDFLECTWNVSNLTRLGELRSEFTCELAEHMPPEGDEEWERIAALVERMLDERLALLALDFPEALIGVRTSTTLH